MYACSLTLFIGQPLSEMVYPIANSYIIVCILLCFPAESEVEGGPTCKQCELNFIIAISFGSSAITLLMAIIIIATLSIIVKRVTQRRHNQSKEHKPDDIVVYEDIEIHQAPLSFCDTTDNVAYSHTASCK